MRAGTTTRLIPIALVGLSLLVAACGGGGGATTGAATEAPEVTEAPADQPSEAGAAG